MLLCRHWLKNCKLRDSVFNRNNEIVLGHASTWVRGFVLYFLRVQQLYCSFPAAQETQRKLFAKPLTKVAAAPPSTYLSSRINSLNSVGTTQPAHEPFLSHGKDFSGELNSSSTERRDTKFKVIEEFVPCENINFLPSSPPHKKR